ncbi:MAG: hydrogenase iron-sulfur subunit [Chloroflexi bacterium]|nr:hydrogenase iron-sulfur subunit [Chloroflexota bacterium]
MFKRPSWTDLQPQVDPETDCLPAPLVEVEEEENEAGWQAVGAGSDLPAGKDLPAAWPWAARPRISGRGALSWIEKGALPFESLANRLVGAQELNPFYHTGTIAVYALLLVAVSGLYLTVFYLLPGLGTGAAYEAVAAIDRQPLWLGQIMRGVHRYASGAAVIATFFHALRTLFQDRFRGARWLAWFSGMVILAVLWLEGMSGYWLVWDGRAQLILDTVLKALGVFPSIGIPYALDFITNEATAQIWLFFLLLLFAHIALFPIGGLAYWFHVLRLSRSRFLPPRHFMIALTAILAALAVALPATSAQKADLGQLPGRMTIDPFFLFYLPATLRTNPAVFWSVTLVLFALVSALPWLLKGRRQPGKVVIDKDVCTGCMNCANDCPYSAIAMMPRADGSPHKLIAIENPGLCVSCGVCVGSCDGMAVSLTDLPAQAYYRSILSRIASARAAAGGPVKVVFTCERHGTHGAEKPQAMPGRQPASVTIVMPCVGALHPNVVGQAFAAGAAEVSVIGCPADDCAQREGSLWIEARLARSRLPRLKRTYANAPIHISLLPPNETAGAAGRPPASPLKSLKPAHFIRGAVLLAAVLALQAIVTDVPYQPYRPGESQLLLGMRNEGELLRASRVLTGPELAQLSHDEQVQYLNEQQAEGRFPTRLLLEVDGKVVLDRTYKAIGLHREGSAYAYEKFFLPAGEHSVRLSADDAGGELKPVLEQTTIFAPNQIHTIMFDRVTDTFELK